MSTSVVSCMKNSNNGGDEENIYNVSNINVSREAYMSREGHVRRVSEAAWQRNAVWLG
jgi:hypothetical protein